MPLSPARCLRVLLSTAAIIASTLSAQTVSAQDQAEQMAAATVARLTVDEKIAQLVNVAPAIPRLNIPAYNWWTESLHGAFGPLPTTNFPEPIGLAATFNPPLIHDVASVIGTEVRAMHTLGRATGHLGKIGTGLDTWSPNINIFRDPRWGRGQETYGEDPFLTAHMGVAFVTGMQGPDPEHPLVIATPKHFAVHSGPESTRHVANVFVSRHDLEDTYLPAFRAAIVEGHAGSIMCAYNRIDGQPACASDDLLKDHLRGAWGFKGYVVSDCDAVVDIADHHKYASDPAAGVAAAFRAGVDNECHTGTIGEVPGLGVRYAEALKRGLLTQADLDRALVRLFAARYRNGDLPGIAGPNTNPVPLTTVDTAQHRETSLRAAVESLVLLKNDGTLPLKQGLHVAVIGPLGDATRVLRGNYSSPNSAPPVSVVEGLRRAMPGAQVTLVPFSASITDGDPVPAGHFLTPDGKPGLHADYFNAIDPTKPRGERTYAATPIARRTEERLETYAPRLKQASDAYKVVWSGSFTVPETGTYRIGVTGVKGAIDVGGKPAIASDHYSQWGEAPKLVEVELKKGERYPLHFEMEAGGAAEPSLVWKRISRDEAGDLRRAVANADVVVAAVGLTSDLEGEEMPIKIDGFAGGDKTALDLPADQRALLADAKALGKPLVVVAMNGSAIDLSWARDNANAIVEAWYPGQSGGFAVGQVLSGTVNPGGRLPLTFYHSLADLPAFDDYGMAGRTYRYFTGKPVYPFGFGLSYTSFAYDGLKVAPVDGDAAKGLHVSARLRNSGQRAGDEVVQLYLRFPQAPGVPNIALRGFQRVTLKPGEAREVSFDLTPRDLSSVDPDGVRSVLAGQYQLSLGGGQPGQGLPTVETGFAVTHGAAIAR
ncbi:glycoside hydrolase family 3 C-terminal domain-containing protein [Novosphingobium terrae]|uniref:glycoside hydrolase family 3 C-terminal domain-containing protein n=1 Tax=Novosphingobium terrae TaxID=2726189 RepID=UPI00197F57A7|nr:glycoside hydrolase family 3 C-terminal domain-containing protein [Novosphingobium terrae]